MYSPIGVDNNGKLNTLGRDAVQAVVRDVGQEPLQGRLVLEHLHADVCG